MAKKVDWQNDDYEEEGAEDDVTQEKKRKLYQSPEKALQANVVQEVADRFERRLRQLNLKPKQDVFTGLAELFCRLPDRECRLLTALWCADVGADQAAALLAAANDEITRALRAHLTIIDRAKDARSPVQRPAKGKPRRGKEEGGRREVKGQ